MITAGAQDDACAAKISATQQLARLPGLVGVGLTRHGGGYAVKVNLKQAVEGRKLPTQVDGVPLVFEIVGAIKPL